MAFVVLRRLTTTTASKRISSSVLSRSFPPVIPTYRLCHTAPVEGEPATTTTADAKSKVTDAFMKMTGVPYFDTEIRCKLCDFTGSPHDFASHAYWYHDADIPEVKLVRKKAKAYFTAVMSLSKDFQSSYSEPVFLLSPSEVKQGVKYIRRVSELLQLNLEEVTLFGEKYNLFSGVDANIEGEESSLVLAAMNKNLKTFKKPIRYIIDFRLLGFNAVRFVAAVVKEIRASKGRLALTYLFIANVAWPASLMCLLLFILTFVSSI